MTDTTTERTDLRQRIAQALLTRIKRATVSRTQPHDAFTSLLAANEYDLADAVLAVLPPPADRAAVLADDEGDELVCVDQCGSCDACGMEPFGTPAEGWRQAAHFLRRTARKSGDRAGALHGARLIEAELRRLADEAQQQEPDETDASEADIDGMLAVGVPVQVVTRPPDTHAAAPQPEPSVHGESVAHLAGLHARREQWADDEREIVHSCTEFDTWFDRTICAEPCGAMHTRCVNCGAALDTCPHAPAVDARQDGAQQP